MNKIQAILLFSCLMIPSVTLLAQPISSPNNIRSYTLLISGHPRYQMREPSVAIDTEEPDHLAVGAYSVEGDGIYTWATKNGGENWMPTKLSSRSLPSDSSLAYGQSCSLFHLYLTAAKVGEQFPAVNPKPGKAKFSRHGQLLLGHSGDCGKNFTTRTLFKNPSNQFQNDKGWMTTDTSPKSPYKNSVYIFWSLLADMNDQRADVSDIRFIYSRDGGKTFSASQQIAKSGYEVQTVVRSDGTLDAIWVEKRWNAQSLLHVTSKDGGKSFSQPQPIVTLANNAQLDIASLSVAANGELIVAWMQRENRIAPNACGDAHIEYSIYANGAWSSPQVLDSQLPRDSLLGLPAVGATINAFWALGYFADKHSTRVLLYRAPLSTHRFSRYATLATRKFGKEGFSVGWLGCNQSEKSAAPPFFPGDYVTLAGARNRLAAAYTLPREDNGKFPSISTLYISKIDDK
jgi:hypothetical protein